MTTAEISAACMGRAIKVNRTYKHIVAGSVGRVIDRDSQNIYIDDYGNYPIKNPSDVTILDSPSNVILDVGEKGTLVKKYNNFEVGQEVVIKEFLDKDKTKAVVDGVMPGGWITASHITPPINWENLRMKTFMEMFADYGWKFMQIFNLGEAISKLFGQPLTCEFIHRCNPDSRFVLNGVWARYTIPKCVTTNDPVINENLAMYIKSTKDIELWCKYHGEHSGNMEKLLKIAGKPITEALGKPNFIPRHDTLSKLRKEGYIYGIVNIVIRGPHLEVR